MPKTDPHARYRQAWQFGSEGKPLPARLGDVADSDPLVDQAHDAARNGVPFSDWLRDNVPSGPVPSTSSPAPARSSSSSGGGKIASASENLGSVLLGLVAGALVLSVYDYGARGPVLWFKAKFLNDATAAKGPPSSTTSAATALPVGAG